MRNHARPINNALALASMKVDEEVLPPDDGHAYNPTLTIRGRLCHRVGRLRAGEGYTPTFAQVYVHDGQEEDEAKREAEEASTDTEMF